MSPLVSARKVCCRVDGKTILDAVDLDLSPGEIVGIVGPNGAGKSTLLRTLNGTQKAEGSVTLGGRALGSLTLNEVARFVAVLPQTTEVGLGFLVREVVALGRHPYQGRFEAPGPRDRALVDEALALTGTQDLARRPVNQLSGGEVQRVMFARVVAQDTPVLLLDEPTAHLDLGHQEALFEGLRTWVQGHRGAVTAIHDLRLAARHCDRLVLLAQGRVVAQGSPAEVLTPGHLVEAYGRSVRVYENPITGQVDYHVRPRSDSAGHHIHVVGGGGSATEILRLLGDRGWKITAGIFSPGDTDLQVARVYGMEVVTGPPFSPFPGSAVAAHRDLARSAALTVVPNLSWGPLNLGCLEGLVDAQRLVILEDSPPEARDFTGGPALALYRRLAAQATVLATAELESWLAKNLV